jgi:glycogen debranching enzyme
VTAWVKVHGGTSGARRTARGFLDGLEAHLSEACLGQVSEIFDAEAPHRPRGCFAQAWSVAEPLRALIEDIGVGGGEEIVRPTGLARTSRRKPKQTTR